MEEAESAFSCKICYQSYDDELKKPYIISPCSHTICLECLKEILLLSCTCPFCKKEIKASICEMKPNYELIDIIYKIKNTNNVVRCSKCKDLINSVYFTEKNSNVLFICKHCANIANSTNKENLDETTVFSLEELIGNAENELNSFQSELSHNINIENLKNLVSNIMSDYLKKTICDLLDQKKDILASFLESPDFSNLIEKYRKSLENIIKSKDASIKYLQANAAILKITVKDQIIHNILNIKSLDNDEILTQKIKNFTQNIHKEFNKNRLFIHGMLSPITSDIIYQANIALFNIVRECLRDDFSLLDKLLSFNVDTYNNMVTSNISNFQQNHIQGGYLFQQTQLKNKLKNLEINDDDNSDVSLQQNMSMNNSIISETYVASVIGLMMDLHPQTNKLKLVLEKQFNCRASLIEKDDGYYGVQLFFRNSQNLENFMFKKHHIFKVDDQTVKLFKKPNKPGNRLYVKYE
jgi:hypothetical protein